MVGAVRYWVDLGGDDPPPEEWVAHVLATRGWICVERDAAQCAVGFGDTTDSLCRCYYVLFEGRGTASGARVQSDLLLANDGELKEEALLRLAEQFEAEC